MTTDRKIAVAADHAGLRLKSVVSEELEALGWRVLDLGTDGPEAVDYPDYGDALALPRSATARQRCGVLVCGSGIGIAIAANRHPHVRAAVCHDVTTARLARRHNDANVLALGARIVGEQVARDCLREFLATAYEGGRHDPRVAKLGRPAPAPGGSREDVADAAV